MNASTGLLLALLGLGILALIAAVKGNINDVVNALFSAKTSGPTDTKKADAKGGWNAQ